MARLYEKMNRKKAQIQHDWDIKVGKKKVTTGKVRKKKQVETPQSAVDMAMETLKNLDEATRALILAQFNKS